jgi:hypothetical protein
LINQGEIMKQWKFAAPFVSLLAAGCGLGGNIYPMAPQQAYDTLVAAHIEPSGNGPFFRLETSVSGDGSSKVYWHGTGSMSAVDCEAELAPEGADKTRVMAHCTGASASDGAAAGMMLGMTRNRLIEHIDATLRGRAFDPRLALGSTAGAWPKDPQQPDGSYGAAVGEALKMDRDMHKAISEMDNMAAEDEARRAERRANGDVNFKPGQPMIDPSK